MKSVVETETCAIAFKEWAVICEALARGRQTIILRKGGIHEGRDGFRVSHPKFWLLPTHFHASPEALTLDAEEFFPVAEALHADGLFQIRYLAEVQDVLELTREEDALALAGLHLWSEDTVRQRFHYKQPGLFGLVVRVFVAPQAAQIVDSPHIAGCRSWVELPEALSTRAVSPVLDDETFARAVAEMKARHTPNTRS